MKKHTTLKSKFNSAFSLVELLVVIAVIAVIAAIAIPNITDITSGATTASEQRQAQNIASVVSAYRAAGGTNIGTNLTTGAAKTTAIGEIDGAGLTRTVSGQVVTFTVGTVTGTGHLKYLNAALNYDIAGTNAE